MRVLLTGATGFIGIHLLRELLNADHLVAAPVRNPEKIRPFTGFENLHTIQGIFFDSRVLSECAAFRPEVVIHLAAISGEGKGRWSEYHRVNVVGTGRLVEFALKQEVTRFVYCSAAGIYGVRPFRLPADPWTAARPEGHYLTSKHRAEKLIVEGLRNRLPFVMLRPALTYGVGCHGTTATLIRLIRWRLLLLPRPDIRIHLLNVHTLVKIILRALTVPLETECIANVADREPIGLSRMADVVHEHFYGRRYPAILRACPAGMYRMMAWITRLMNARGVSYFFKLLTDDWYYDTVNLERTFEMPLTDTREGLRQYLQKAFPGVQAQTAVPEHVSGSYPE
ncbi:MAG: NAD(P)-dependent oxidoreductase [Calditrichaeota bacterium]|nr:MAG: NAD(P)-dependent oxidoreductase [Calditrichota bacterium]